MHTLHYKPSDSDCLCRVIFGNTLANIDNTVSDVVQSYRSLLFIVDDALPEEYVNIVEDILKLKSSAHVKINANKKTLDKVEVIWDAMVETVPDAAVVIGGGTVCDLAGVACANYQRGIPRILFPTTVMAMVDASIGGKSGIDYQNVKNAVGAIHYPPLVINYLPFLKSLADEEYFSGFSEIVKAAVLYDKNFFDDLLKLTKDNAFLRSREVINVLARSAQIKASICEQGRGKTSLLYGHAIGHALEASGKVKLRHGDCVSIGMHIEGAIACELGIWNQKEWHQQHQLLQQLHLPTGMSRSVTINEISKKMLLYKKLVDSKNYLLVLPREVGRVNNAESTYLTAIPRDKFEGLLKDVIRTLSSSA